MTRSSHSQSSAFVEHTHTHTHTHTLKPLPTAVGVRGRSLWGSRHLAAISLVLFSRRHLPQLGQRPY